MDHPEWAGYLAAFDAYVDARRRDDDELAEQARILMGYFAGPLLERQNGSSGRRPRLLREGNLVELIEMLERRH